MSRAKHKNKTPTTDEPALPDFDARMDTPVIDSTTESVATSGALPMKARRVLHCPIGAVLKEPEGVKPGDRADVRHSKRHGAKNRMVKPGTIVDVNQYPKPVLEKLMAGSPAFIGENEEVPEPKRLSWCRDTEGNMQEGTVE